MYSAVSLAAFGQGTDKTNEAKMSIFAHFRCDFVKFRFFAMGTSKCSLLSLINMFMEIIFVIILLNHKYTIRTKRRESERGRTRYILSPLPLKGQ
jgi:hypothetical protein